MSQIDTNKERFYKYLSGDLVKELKILSKIPSFSIESRQMIADEFQNPVIYD